MLMEKIKNSKNKNIWIISGVVIAIFLGLLCFILIHALGLDRDTLYPGLHIGDVNVSNMTLTEAREAVSVRYQNALSKTITIQSESYQKEISLSALASAIDLEATVENVYSVGRSGNIFRRIVEVNNIKKNGHTVPPILACDDTALETLIGELASFVDIPEVEMQVAIDNNEMIITRGKPGKRIIIDKAITYFKTHALTAPNNLLVIEPEQILPKEPNIDALCEEYCGEPVNATYKIENQKLIITEEKDGVVLNKAEAQQILNETIGDKIRIPVVVTPAEITVEQVKNELFPDMLARYTTNYNAGDVSRSHNVALACEKINEVVLAPGDVFSYNDTLGPRTVDRGFRTANVYVGNKVEPGVGGGICQVSSTLFNTVVLADLKIVYRTNHSLPVSYVPLGRDATVSYGSIDFKFSNNTKAPIKIVASASGGKNVVAIYGVKENPNKTIEISTQNTSTIPCKVIQTESPDIPAGTVKVEQKGSNGSTYNTYKITKENGVVVKNELLTKSTYVPTDRIELIGTQAVDAMGNPVIAPEEGTPPGDNSAPTQTPSANPSGAPISVPESEESPAASPAV